MVQKTNPFKFENKHPDKFYLIHMKFFIIGLAHMVPWSFFPMANDYWMYKFRDVNATTTDSDSRTPLQVYVTTAILTTLRISSLIFLVIATVASKRVAFSTMIGRMLMLMLALLLVTMGLVKLDTDTWQAEFFGLTLILIAACNGANSVMGVGMYDAITNFPADYLTSYLTGQGVSGLAAALLQIAALSVGASSDTSALVYFGCAAYVVVAASVAVACGSDGATYRHYMASAGGRPTITWPETWRIIKKIWRSIVVTGLWMISVGPVHTGVTALIVPEYEDDSAWKRLYFVPTVTFFGSSLMDVAGRISAHWMKNTRTDVAIGVSILRPIIFVPLLLLCNARPRNYLPVLFPHDYQYVIILLVYSFSNGLLYNLGYLMIIKHTDREEQRHAYFLLTIINAVFISMFSSLSYLCIRFL